MSRSTGSRSLTTVSPTRISPEVGCSSPATILRAVVLPQPGRADEDHELAVLDPQVKVVDCNRAVLEALRDAAELDRRH